MRELPSGQAAEVAGVTPQIVRDRVVRFNEEGPDAPINRKAPGPQQRRTDARRRPLAARVEAGPDPDADGVVRWRRVGLAHRSSRFRFGGSAANCGRWGIV